MIEKRSNSITFGQWLKRRRKALDLTQEELAQRIGCSDIAIRKIEAGARRPSRQVAELLAELLKVPASEREEFISFARGLDDHDQARASGAISGHHPPLPSNLPAPITRLIGREEVVVMLRDLLTQNAVHVLTLTGPPGIGKTRLAIQVARDMKDHFKDGAFFVGLAPVNDPKLVVPTIAEVLGLTDQGPELLLVSLQRWLSNRQMLLVLDNFEQVLDASLMVVEMLGASSDLKVLVTSREALHIPGEQQFPVPTLQTANPAHLPPIETLPTYPAVALFIERARAVKPDFAITEQNAQAIALICARLEGLPLAIELAAAHIRLLTPQEMQAHLDTRLSLPAGRLRSLPARQQTLRAAISWSYNLLSGEEQTLFARLGVFVGGFTLAAAEAVCNAKGDISTGVLVGLAALVDKSLVHREENAHSKSRYTMLEMIRVYAVERLADSGEAEEIRRLHAEYHLALAEAGEQASKGAEQLAWSERLEREHDNLRAGLRWASQSEDVELTLRLVGALGWFWEAHAHIREGQEWLAEVLSLARASRVHTSRAFAKTLNAAGRLAYRQGKVGQARSLLEENVAVCRKLNDRQSVLESLQNLGHVASHQGDFASARLYREESLVISRELGDKWAIAGALIGLGDQRVEDGDLEAARAAFEESMAVYGKIGSKWGAARALNGLGDVARCRGDYSAARALYEKSLAIHRQLGAKGFMDLVLHNLGHVAQHEGDLARARRYFKESLTLFQEQGQLVGVGVCLVGLAGVASTENAWRAAVLLGAAKALLDSIGYHMDHLDRIEYNRYASVVYTLLDKQANKASHKHGQNMTMEQAVAYALMNNEPGVVRRSVQPTTEDRFRRRPVRQIRA